MMFTVKFRIYDRARSQPADCSSPVCYDEYEQIHGPFHLVSKEVDEDGYVVVHCHRDAEAPGYTFGPYRPDEAAGVSRPRPTLWVMNEQGATVARYDL